MYYIRNNSAWIIQFHSLTAFWLYNLFPPWQNIQHKVGCVLNADTNKQMRIQQPRFVCGEACSLNARGITQAAVAQRGPNPAGAPQPFRGPPFSPRPMNICESKGSLFTFCREAPSFSITPLATSWYIWWVWGDIPYQNEIRSREVNQALTRMSWLQRNERN